MTHDLKAATKLRERLGEMASMGASNEEMIDAMEHPDHIDLRRDIGLTSIFLNLRESSCGECGAAREDPRFDRCSRCLEEATENGRHCEDLRGYMIGYEHEIKAKGISVSIVACRSWARYLIEARGPDGEIEGQWTTYARAIEGILALCKTNKTLPFSRNTTVIKKLI